MEVQKAVVDEVRKAEADFRYFGATPRILNAEEIINGGKPNSFLSMGLDGNLNVVPERFPRDFNIPLIRMGLREELIHAVWVAMLRAKGNRSGGREVEMEKLAKDYTQEVFDQLASTAAGRQLIQDSMNLYDGEAYTAKPWPEIPYPDQEVAVNRGNRSDVTPSLIAEMTRQLVQTRMYDHQTEIVLARAFGSFEEWMKDIAERLRAVAKHPHRVSPLLNDAVLHIEGQLKALQALREKRWGKKWDAFERTRVPR